MAYSVILSDGTTDYEFVYDPTSQVDYKMYYGARVDMGEPRALWHTADDGARTLVRLVDDPGTIFITQNVKGEAAWDNVINNITQIKRLIDGQDQQAARDDLSRVYIRIQLDGATNYTEYTVIFGHVDDSGSYYKTNDVANTEATGVVLMLNIEPKGRGEAFTLRNDLANSPHMLRDSNSDGLADGLNLAGTPTATISSIGLGLVGPVCQKIVTDSSTGEGFKTDPVTASSSSNAVATVWIRSIGDPVSIQLLDGSEVQIQSIEHNATNPVNHDYVVSGGGSTWYRYTVSGTNVNANFKIRIIRTSGNASQVTNFWVDALYLQTGTLTAPSGMAWCSSEPVRNRYDPSATNPDYINYFDTWGLPGDSNARIRQKWNTASTNVAESLVVGKISDGKLLAADYNFFIDSDEFSNETGWTNPADATRSGGTYKLVTVPNTNEPSYAAGDTETALWAASAPHVFIMAYATNAATTFQVKFSVGPNDYESEAKAPQAINTWSLVDLGLINIAGLQSDWDIIGTLSSVKIAVSGSAGTARVDGVWFFPTQEYMQTPLQEISINGINPAIDGIEEKLFLLDVFNYYRAQQLGGMWEAASGQKMTRFLYFLAGTKATPTFETHSLNSSLSLDTFEVIPQTKHILGTS